MRVKNAIIRKIELKTKGEVFGSKLKYGEPFERVLLLHLVVVDGGKQLAYFVEVFNLLDPDFAPNSKYARFVRVYGEPRRGMIVPVWDAGKSGRWEICLLDN